MTWSLLRIARPVAKRLPSGDSDGGCPLRRPGPYRRRRPVFETLEARTVLAALPYGAMPDDTGEYMLGDVHVTVVLMESDPTRAPFDNNPVPQGIGAPAENWTTSSIAAIKNKVQEGMQWWEQTLDNVLEGTPAAGRDLLNFTFDWTYANNPVRTGYEPIARASNDFALWIYDFLNVVGFNQTGNFSSDIRAFNNFQRQSNDTDWAFTIFVVNNEQDADKMFAPGGSFSKAFAFAGGRMMVVPADRPASSFAHEAGHMFWALDEYAGSGSNHLSRRGYYNTPNTNYAGNPGSGFEQQASIMASASLLDAAYAANITSQSSREMLGWRDTDGDGLFDVLDVPFALEGVGQYDAAEEVYRFSGNSGVRTLPNQNSSGLQNDITINQIRQAQVSIDGGPWTVVQSFPSRTYETALDLNIPLSPGSHVIKIRTIDTRTGAMSPEFIGTTGEPSSTPTYGGISGFVYRDDNSNGVWDAGEPPLPDWAMNLVDEHDQPLDLRRQIEPNQYVEGTLLNGVHAEATLAALGGDAFGNEVTTKTTSRSAVAGKVFGVRSVVLGQVVDTWTSNRQLRVDFSAPVSSVSLRAYGGSSSTSFARLEAYNSEGTLLGRYTTKGLSSGVMERMSLSRANGDIAYVIARGHLGTQVMLDTLEWGPFASATTNTLGAYSISGVPAGDYRLKIDVPLNHTVTTVGGAIVSGALAVGAAANVNFGIVMSAVTWYNATNPLNVNGDPDSFVTAADALLVIDWLNANSGKPSQLPATPTPHLNGYIDVNKDGHCTAADALLIIDHLNVNSSSFAPPSGSSGSSSFIPPSGSGNPEGEERIAQNAAEYYAAGPLHFLDIASDSEVHIHDDEFHSDEHDHSGEIANSQAATGFVHSASLLLTLDTLVANRELPPAAERVLDLVHTWIESRRDSLDRVALRLDEVLHTIAGRRDELDESLDTIANDVSIAWTDLIETARFRRS